MVMRRIVSSVVAGVVGVLCATASLAQTEDVAKGAALLAEARKALGGDDKFAAIKRLQIKGEMKRGQGNLTLDGDSEVFLEPPDKFRRNESLSLGPGGPGIDRVEVLNGTEIWDENNGGGGRGFGRGGDFGGGGRGDFGGFGGGGRRGGFDPGQVGGGDQGRGQGIDPERLKEAQLRNRRTEVARLLLAILLTTDSPVAWIGTAQSPDGTADVLEVKGADGVATRLFLESNTHVPLMITWSSGGGQRGFRGGGQGQAGPGQGGQGRGGNVGQGGQRGQDGAARGGDAAPPAGAAPDTIQGRRTRPAGGGAAATLEMHVSEYKAVNGVKLPHLITRGTNGETAEEWIIKSYRINPTFKGNTFTK
jgi:hypothetical protein